MSVIFVGDNYSDFTNGGSSPGTFAKSTNATFFDADYANFGLLTTWGGSTAGAQARGPQFAAPLSEWWFHCELYNDGSFFARESGVEFVLNNDRSLALTTDGASGNASNINQFNFCRWNGSAWVTFGTRFTVPLDARSTIDIFVRPSTSTSGTVRVYVNQALVLNFTGVVAGGSAQNIVTFDRLVFSGTGNLATQAQIYSETVVTDAEADSTLGWRVATLNPTGVGASSDLTGTFADIDDGVAEDLADFIASDTNAEKSTFAFDDLPAAVGTDDIVQVCLFLTAEKLVGANVDSYDVITRPGTTDNASDNSGAMGTGPFKRRVDLTTNPDTSLAWEASEIDATEFGIRVNT